MEHNTLLPPNALYGARYNDLNQEDRLLIPRKPVSRKPVSTTTSVSITKSQSLQAGAKREETPPQSPLQSASEAASRPRLRLFSVLRWWLPELVASILSVASFISIVAVSRHYDGRSLDDLRLPNGLTLNGIIAALSTLNRVSLMVPVGSAMSQEAWLWFSAPSRRSRLGDLDLSDGASRGSWGSFVFLYSSRGYRLLACLGALVTILSLAFGTFTQQILGIKNLAVVDPLSKLAPGNLPRSEAWSSYKGLFSWGPEPLLNMKAAIINGMLTDVAPIAAVCSTGNCTWPQTSSLAVCGQCVQSPYKTNCIPLFDRSFDVNVATGSICNYTMPSGSVMTIGMSMDSEPMYTGFQVTPQQGGHFNQSTGKRVYLATFDIFGAPYGVETAVQWPKEPWANASTVSSECALWWCVQTYSTKMQLGTQVQTIVSSVEEPVEQPHDFISSAYFSAPLANPIAGNATNFTVGGYARATLGGYLGGQLNGNIFLNRVAFANSSTTEAVWNGTTNLDKWIQNVATSITNVIRTDNPLPRAVLNGTAYQLAYTIRWEWLILPAAMVLLSVLLWIAIMVKTARSPVEAWKGSPLTLLLFDVDQDTKRSVSGQTDKYRGIEKTVARKRSVLVGEPGLSWKFKAI